MTGSSPLAVRRHLALTLRDIRIRCGRSAEKVCAEIGWSPSKLSRCELARVPVKPGDVGRLLDCYGVTGTERARLIGLAEEASRKPWWEDFADDMTPGMARFVGLEQGAASILTWRQDIIPELLQTESYARHILDPRNQVDPIWPALAERLVRLRAGRQKILEPGSDVRLSVVLDEAVLFRPAGNGAMVAQLQRLVDDSCRDNVNLQVLPLSVPGRVPGGSFTVFQFGGAQPDCVAVEGLREIFFVDGDQESYLYSVAFQLLAQAALGPGPSRDLILAQAASWPGASLAPA